MSKIFKSGNVSYDLSKKFILEAVRPAEKPVVTVENPTPVKTVDQVGEAKKEAFRIIKRANDEADKILADVRRQCEKIKKESEEKGRAEGYKAGYEKGSAQGDEIKLKAQREYDEFMEQKSREQADREPALVDLIVGITDKLLKKAVAIKPDLVLAMIHQGLAESSGTGELLVRVSAEDYDTVMANRETFLSKVEGGARIEIVKDLSLSPLDCIIETPFGNIDCSLDQQFQALKESLYFICESRGEAVQE